MSHFLARTVVESSAVTHCITGNFTEALVVSTLIAKVNILELLYESCPGILSSVGKQSLPEPVLGLSSVRSKHEVQRGDDGGQCALVFNVRQPYSH